jgi:hypothetical protein
MVAIETTGHRRSMYSVVTGLWTRRISERGTEKLQSHVESRDETKVVPLRVNRRERNEKKADNSQTERISIASKLTIAWWSRWDSVKNRCVPFRSGFVRGRFEPYHLKLGTPADTDRNNVKGIFLRLV